MVAVSVDAAAQSETLRAQLSLPFPILCDVDRHVVGEWGVLNARERGGIAKPSVFVIDPTLIVRYAAVGTVTSRVPATEIASVLENARDAAQIRRKSYLPLPGDWIRAVRNNFRKK